MLNFGGVPKSSRYFVYLSIDNIQHRARMLDTTLLKYLVATVLVVSYSIRTKQNAKYKGARIYLPLPSWASQSNALSLAFFPNLVSHRNKLKTIQKSALVSPALPLIQIVCRLAARGPLALMVREGRTGEWLRG